MSESLGNRKSKEKPELGSFEFIPDVGLVPRKQVSLWDILKNEEKYIKSESRNKAISDLEETWDKSFEVEMTRNVANILEDFEYFKVFVDEIIDKESFKVKFFLKKILIELENAKSSFTVVEETFLNRRIDFERTDDMDINDKNKLKNILDLRLALVERYLESIKTIIEFVNSKLNEVK